MVQIISFGKTELTEEKFIQPKNDWIKPIGGIWGSTYIPDEVCSSDWERWCIEENFGYNWREAVIFTLKPDAKVYEIDSVQDLNNLTEEYNMHSSAFLATLNFEAMVAAGIDAIHLTEKGQAETRFSRPYSLYGWDVESWLILNINAIDEQRPATRSRMHHLMEQMINAKTATGMSAAMNSFAVAIGSRGCGKMLAMQQELAEMARIGETEHQREVMGIISDDGLDGIRYALEGIADTLKDTLQGLVPDIEIEDPGPSPTEIKKRLKYAKNPMEIKKLNQELTAAYKRYKGGSRNGIERR